MNPQLDLNVQSLPIGKKLSQFSQISHKKSSQKDVSQHMRPDEPQTRKLSQYVLAREDSRKTLNVDSPMSKMKTRDYKSTKKMMKLANQKRLTEH